MSTAHYGRAVPLALRRFRKLPCITHPRPPPVASAEADGEGGVDDAAARASVGASSSRAPAPESAEFELPSSMPQGLHVVLLLNRLKQIEHVDSWLSVREAWERLLHERGHKQEGELQMYITCLLPRFWPLRWLWRRRMSEWSEMLGDENPSVHMLSSTASQSEFYEKMQIPNDRRLYAMLIRNDGEIIWASHDKFKEHMQEKAMVHVVNRECKWRADEQQKLLEASSKVAGELDETSSQASTSAGDSESPASENSTSAGQGQTGNASDASQGATARSQP
eukprot:TRINITY_DN27299_c0_g1_i1.p1 TRINITY_DN27299_c0_g1~~TRINITY_DN27299_c0_g1_i1.p1  ORF type:complete len:280 (-),score=48.30 TRINITY_DN27299_c0_g1_i1:71-910(-)